MWNVIFKEISQFRIRNGSQFFGITGALPVLAMNVVRDGEWALALEYLVFILFVFICAFISIEVPHALYLCPLTREQRQRYVTQAFWLRIVLGNLVHLIVNIVLVLSDFVNLPFAILSLMLFMLTSLLMGMMDFINFYRYCTDLCRTGTVVAMVFALFEVFIMLGGKQIGWNFETISGVLMLLFMAWVVQYMFQRFYRIMINVCSDYELSSKRIDPYRGRKVSRAR